MKRHEVSEAEWAILEPLIPKPEASTGRPAIRVDQGLRLRECFIAAEEESKSLADDRLTGAFRFRQSIDEIQSILDLAVQSWIASAIQPRICD